MKTVAIAGGSGVVGTRVLYYLLGREDVARVIAVGRRRLALEHGKLVSRVADLQNQAAVGSAIDDRIDVALCCLGTTIKQAGSQPAFRAVDHDAVVTFAHVALERGAHRFVLVSSIGADPRARGFYLRTKGEAEEAIAGLGYQQVTVLRPSLIDDEGARRDHRRLEQVTLRLARRAFAILGSENRYAPIRADVIAKAMVRLAFDPISERIQIVESDALHRLGA